MVAGLCGGSGCCVAIRVAGGGSGADAGIGLGGAGVVGLSCFARASLDLAFDTALSSLSDRAGACLPGLFDLARSRVEFVFSGWPGFFSAVASIDFAAGRPGSGGGLFVGVKLRLCCDAPVEAVDFGPALLFGRFVLGRLGGVNCWGSSSSGRSLRRVGVIFCSVFVASAAFLPMLVCAVVFSATGLFVADLSFARLPLTGPPFAGLSLAVTAPAFFIGARFFLSILWPPRRAFPNSADCLTSPVGSLSS